MTTSWVHVLVFPLLSLATQVTKVLPMGKTAGALLVTVTAVQSFTVGTPKPTNDAKHEPKLALFVTLGGQAIVGGLASITVTVAEQLFDAPLESVTVIKTRFVVPVA